MKNNPRITIGILGILLTLGLIIGLALRQLATGQAVAGPVLPEATATPWPGFTPEPPDTTPGPLPPSPQPYPTPTPDARLLALPAGHWRVQGQKLVYSSSSAGNVAWAPDSSRFVFVAEGDRQVIGPDGQPVDTQRDLWIVSVSDSQASLLVENAQEPVWSSDGQKVVYLSRVIKTDGTTTGQWDLFAISPQDKQPILVRSRVNPYFGGLQPLHSLPDGIIALIEEGQIKRLRLDGQEAAPPMVPPRPATDIQVQFSTDGRYAALLLDGKQLVVEDLATEEELWTTNGNIGWASDLGWSGDSAYLSYTTYETTGPPDYEAIDHKLWVVKVGEWAPRLLVTWQQFMGDRPVRGSAFGGPRWSADGKTLFLWLATELHAPPNSVAVDVETGQVTRIEYLAYGVTIYSLSPERRHVVLSEDDPINVISYLWLAELETK